MAVILTQYDKAWSSQDIIYTVSDIKQATDKNTHLADDVVVTGNGSATPSLDKLEIGDEFTLTAKAVGLSLETSVTVKFGADKKAKISTNADDNTDEKFRKDYLNMKR